MVQKEGVPDHQQAAVDAVVVAGHTDPQQKREAVDRDCTVSVAVAAAVEVALPVDAETLVDVPMVAAVAGLSLGTLAGPVADLVVECDQAERRLVTVDVGLEEVVVPDACHTHCRSRAEIQSSPQEACHHRQRKEEEKGGTLSACILSLHRFDHADCWKLEHKKMQPQICTAKAVGKKVRLGACEIDKDGTCCE